MTEQQLRQELQSALKSVKRINKAVISIMIVNIVVILGAVWWAASIDQRVTHIEKDEAEIKEAMVDRTSWKYNDYFTRYLWAERWNQSLPEPPYNIRGAAPNL